jgi:hydrogenase nickel incorporation protein HypA/HybF
MNLTLFCIMHELSIAQNIIDIVRQHLPAGEFHKVRAVKIRVGDMAGIVSDSVEFCFNVITTGTPMEGAELVIERVPLVIRCNKCLKEHTLNDLAFRCPFCSNPDVQVVSGNELQVIEIEVTNGQSEVP